MIMLDSKFIDLTDRQDCFMQYSDRAMVDASAEEVFTVLADIERYPEFLPGWQKVNILEHVENEMRVRQVLGFKFLNWAFETKAVLDYPYHIRISTVGNNSAQFLIDWNISSIDKRKSWLSVVITTECLTGPQHRFLHSMLSHSVKPLISFFTERIVSGVIRRT